MGEERNWRFCVVGNIVKTHLDEDGVIRYGTKAFTGGTKVYIPEKYLEECWEDIDTLLVIGLNRFGRYALEYAVPLEFIENIRFQILFKPTVLNIIDYEEIIEGAHCWGRTAADKKDAKAFAEALQRMSLKMKGDSNN